MWPVHTWLPDAHVEAPTAGSVILAGVLLKLGGYGFIRFSLPMFPLASAYFTPLMFALSAIAVIYTSFVALAQTDMKKLIAYSSIAHMGFVTMGLFALTSEAVQGAMIQMLSHGLVSAALFLVVGVVYDRLHTRDIDRYGGLADRMPAYAFVFMCIMLASVGLPGTSGFVGEFLILLGTFRVIDAGMLPRRDGAVPRRDVHALPLSPGHLRHDHPRPIVRGMLDLSPREMAGVRAAAAAGAVDGRLPDLVPDADPRLGRQPRPAGQRRAEDGRSAAQQLTVIPAKAGIHDSTVASWPRGSRPSPGRRRRALMPPLPPPDLSPALAGNRAGLRRDGAAAHRRVPRRGLDPARFLALGRGADRHPGPDRHLGDASGGSAFTACS